MNSMSGESSLLFHTCVVAKVFEIFSKIIADFICKNMAKSHNVAHMVFDVTFRISQKLKGNIYIFCYCLEIGKYNIFYQSVERNISKDVWNGSWTRWITPIHRNSLLVIFIFIHCSSWFLKQGNMVISAKNFWWFHQDWLLANCYQEEKN